MSDFGWLAALDAGAWTTSFGDKRCISMTLAEFAARSRCAHPQLVIREFRTWMFAQQSHHYALVWKDEQNP